MKIIADLNDEQEKTLTRIKRLGYVFGEEINTKPQQISLAMDLLQYLLWEFKEQEIIEIYLKNK